MIEKVLPHVKACGDIIKNADRNSIRVDEKSGKANFVTSYDKLVQQEIRKKLLKEFPDAVFVGEEEDIHSGIEKGYAFIVDPIDGTTNFMKDYHHSCISVGVTLDGEEYAGAVYDPYLDEMFYAEKGKGAFVNGEPIHVSDTPAETGIILFGTSPYYPELSEKSFRYAYELFLKAMDVRRSGSAALDLCYVASGRAEMFFECRLSPWDFAAGSIIVEEAGGRITTMEGEKISFSQPISILASNGK